MELSLLALQAANIALWAVDKLSGGALEQAGANILSLLSKKLHGKLRVGESKPALIQAAILSEAENDKKFQLELEELVSHFNSLDNGSVYQNTDSGVNVNVGNNSGTVIGQQIGQQFFR